MKSLTKELWMDIPKRRQIISIHSEVEQLVSQSGVQDGLCLVNPIHIALHTRRLQSLVDHAE